MRRMNSIRPWTLLFLSIPLLATSSPATAPWIPPTTTELRRETQIEFGSCDTSQFSDEFPVSTAYVTELMRHVVRNNTNVFHGNLSFENICIGVAYHPIGGRAWAQADKRTIRIDSDMILRVQNDAQLALIISHELAHVSLRHFIEDQEHLVTGKPDYLREMEADRVGAHLYLRAGFTSDELAWRHQQLTPIIVASGRRPGFQPDESLNPHDMRQSSASRSSLSRGIPDVHAHLPPMSAAERRSTAYRACSVHSDPNNMSEPPIGILRYPSECWTIWDLLHGQPQHSSEYRTLMRDSRSLVTVVNSPSLAQAKAELNAYVPPPDLKAQDEAALGVGQQPTTADDVPPKKVAEDSEESYEDDDGPWPAEAVPVGESGPKDMEAPDETDETDEDF